MDNKTIATTIYSQMKTLDRNLIMCMGVSGLTTIELGLQFKVNGLSFKGYVEITLNGKDLYDITFKRAVRKQNQAAKELGVKMFDTTVETVKVLNDVYSEDMMGLLEYYVENRENKNVMTSTELVG